MRGAVRWAWIGLAWLAGWAEAGRAGPVVQLTGWSGEGTMIRGHGQGPDLVFLSAEATWDPSASRDPSRYQVRATFPDGRTETRAFPVDTPPGRRRFSVYVPARLVRNLPPMLVKVGVTVLDASTGATLSNSLEAGIEQFPRPKGDASTSDPGPFGWGTPLGATPAVLPNASPDGFRFARVPGAGNDPSFYIATTEATVKQVGDRLKGYDPKAGRSDEFALEGPDQPAVGLTPDRALAYLDALSKGEGSGVTFRLPTPDDWRSAARGGKETAFWWGDDPTYPAGANLIGPEPALKVDATAPSLPPEAAPSFQANPFGLYHVIGNVAEWAADRSGKATRMGGHFRTEPASPLPELGVEGGGEVGPDPFVGVRPAFGLSPEEGAAIARKKLAGDPNTAGIGVSYDPDRATVTLTGKVAEASTRRSADTFLQELWFVSAVENKLETPAVASNQLATLGPALGSPKKVASLGETFLEVPMAVRWLDPLAVSGSEYWVNVYLPNGGHYSHKLEDEKPGRSKAVLALVDRAKLAAIGIRDGSPMTVALSLGGPSPTLDGPNVVSNAAVVAPAGR